MISKVYCIIFSLFRQSESLSALEFESDMINEFEQKILLKPMTEKLIALFLISIV